MDNDFIKREDAIAEINKRSQYICDNDCCGAIIRTENVINVIPAADVRPVVHARWKYTWTAEIGETVCSACEHTGYEHFNFCPNCGAMMDLED